MKCIVLHFDFLYLCNLIFIGFVHLFVISFKFIPVIGNNFAWNCMSAGKLVDIIDCRGAGYL